MIIIGAESEKLYLGLQVSRQFQMELPMDVTASYRLRLLVRLSWACELKMKPR
jgi:hypothetical protein